jgi:hypothetical protein
VRVFRVFKMGKSFAGLNLMVGALKASQQVFGILTFLVCIAMIVFSSGIFYLETDTTKGCEDLIVEKLGAVGAGRCPFRSIPSSFWWAIVTMTTVGYGDAYPMTSEGRTLGVLAMIVGILTIAMPITVIGDNFGKAYESQNFEDEVIKRVTRSVSKEEAAAAKVDNAPREEGEPTIDLEKMFAMLEDLEVRGNLKIARPKDQASLVALLSQYDAGGDGVLRMQQREWRVFLHDVVIDPSCFTHDTVKKLARDMHNAQVEAARMHSQVDRMHADLRALIEARKKKG